VAESRLALSAMVVYVLLAITAPVTTLLLARTGLFRQRLAGKQGPAAFGGNPERAAPAVPDRQQ
jgi:multicomponent K+:H+ antiporter subunit G